MTTHAAFFSPLLPSPYALKTAIARLAGCTILSCATPFKNAPIYHDSNHLQKSAKRTHSQNRTPMPRIVIPDDSPPVMAASHAYRKLLSQTPVDYHDTLPATEEL